MTTYTNAFSGDVIQPTDVSYESITLTADLTLIWPVNGGTTQTPAARIMNVTASSGSLSLIMPPANQVSVGQDALIRNVGSNTFTVKDSAGGTIGTINAGAAKYLYVIDNSTAAGIWSIFTFGTGTSGVDASALAGYGLLALSNTLNQAYTITAIGTGYTFATTDRSSALVYSGGAGSITLPAASTLGSNWFTLLKNNGTGSLTVNTTSSQYIDGAIAKVFNPNESAFIICTGTSFFTVGYGQSTTFSFTALTKSVTGGTVNLTVNEASNTIQTYIGTLTSSVTVIFPPVVNFYVISNKTTAGSYSLTVSTGSGATATVPANGQATVYCDGTNFYNANTTQAGASTFNIVDGSSSNPSLAFASEPSTGVYRPGTGQFGIAVLGVQMMYLTATGMTVNGTGNFTSGISGGTF